MKKFELIQGNNLNEQEENLLNPDEQIKNIMHREMLNQLSNNNILESIIIANEIALAGFEIKTLLSEDQINKFKDELQQLRNIIKKENNPVQYIDLARCLYRFQNIDIDYPPLDIQEQEILRTLPERIRNSTDWPKDHLVYLPQIASTLNQDIETLRKPNDKDLILKKIEVDIQTKEGDEQKIHSMVIGGGLLAQFDYEAAQKLLESEVWKNSIPWSEILKYFEKIKKENNGWVLARLLPPMQVLIKLHRQKNN